MNGLDGVTGTAAVLLLRRTRLRRFRPSALDVIAFAIGGVIVLALLVSAVVAATEVEVPVSAVVSGDLATTLVGGAIVAALLAALASGARGGPLRLAAPVVMIVMLAPVERGAVLRGPAVRQVVAAAVAGAFVGVVAWVATAGALVPRGAPGWWAGSGAMAGIFAAGLATLGAGLRLSDRASVVARVLVFGWWLMDATLGVVTSPMAALARLPFGAADPAVIAYAAAVSLAAALLGVLRVGGMSIERAWRRTGSADQLRVALGLNDLRTAILILRRRSGESPRNRPWVSVGGRWSRRHPIAARSVRALVRSPLSRAVRFALLAASTGAVFVASADHLILAVLGAVMIFAGALDAVDALAQEWDHPDLQRGYPVRAERLAASHLSVPLASMTIFCLLGSLVAGSVGGSHVAVVGALASPLLAVAAVAGAAVTASRAARPLTRVTDLGLPVEVVFPRILARVAAPIVPLVATALPLVAATPTHGTTAVLTALPGAALAVAVLLGQAYRTRIERFVLRVLVRIPDA